jgi:hypothetical protein
MAAKRITWRWRKYRQRLQQAELVRFARKQTAARRILRIWREGRDARRQARRTGIAAVEILKRAARIFAARRVLRAARDEKCCRVRFGLLAQAYAIGEEERARRLFHGLRTVASFRSLLAGASALEQASFYSFLGQHDAERVASLT